MGGYRCVIHQFCLLEVQKYQFMIALKNKIDYVKFIYIFVYFLVCFGFLVFSK